MSTQPLLVAVAPNGARKTKADLSQIPLTPDEIAQTAKDCLDAGAAMIHLHVRNPEDSSHSLSVGHYQAAIAAIEVATQGDTLIQVTSEAVGIYSPEQQFEMIHALKPLAVSIGLREIQSLDEASIQQHFRQMKAVDTNPQIILYNAVDLAKYHDWLERQVLPGEAYPILLVIGKETPDGSFDNDFLIEQNISKIKASSWMVCGFGAQEFETCRLAIALGGHIRLGFENNSVLNDGSEAQDNAALIEQVLRDTHNSRPVADLAEAIAIMRPNY